MKNGPIKIAGVYGAKIGGKTVFTYEAAVEIYKLFIETCYEKFDREGALVLANVEDDMLAIGFSFDELETMESAVLA